MVDRSNDEQLKTYLQFQTKYTAIAIRNAMDIEKNSNIAPEKND